MPGRRGERARRPLRSTVGHAACPTGEADAGPQRQCLGDGVLGDRLVDDAEEIGERAATRRMR
jgi:hypothetical protein